MRHFSTPIALTALAHVLGAQMPSCTSPRTMPRDGVSVDLPVTIISNHFVIAVCRGDRPLTFVLDTGGGTRGVVAVDVKFFERNKIEQPKPSNAARIMEVCERSEAFIPDVRRLLGRSDLAVLWLEHLLLHSMLQHESRQWTWGRYVVVHPADNPDVVDLLTRYRGYLADDSTFATMTVGDLLASRALPAATTKALRDRYATR